jgi:hypothetical protein
MLRDSAFPIIRFAKFFAEPVRSLETQIYAPFADLLFYHLLYECEARCDSHNGRAK